MNVNSLNCLVMEVFNDMLEFLFILIADFGDLHGKFEHILRLCLDFI